MWLKIGNKKVTFYWGRKYCFRIT